MESTKQCEQLEILTHDGKMAGYSVSREEAHKKGLWHRTVHIWILNSSRMLLVQKRSPEKETHPDKWDVSCAGHLSAGDQSIDGALRELKEELGISVAGTELQFLFTITQCSANHKLKLIDNEFSDVYLLRKDILPEILLIQKEELTEVKFIGIGELKSRTLQFHDPEFVPHDDEYKRLFDILEVY